jgi:hypothetical protein
VNKLARPYYLDFAFGCIFVGFLANFFVFTLLLFLGESSTIYQLIYRPWWVGYIALSLVGGTAWAKFKHQVTLSGFSTLTNMLVLLTFVAKLAKILDH